MTESQVRAKLAQVTEVQGVKEFATANGITPQHVYSALKGGSIGPKLLKALGLRELERHFAYAGPPVRAATGAKKP